ncbi:CCT motif family protein [Euphorbia peplus]|nr:CCT motif family protein [Euphorbia peplus]
MYGHNPRADYNSPSPDGAAYGHLIIPEYMEVGSSSTSSYGSPSSVASYCTCTTQQPSLMQRSMSSHSLVQRNMYYGHCNLGCVDIESSPFRRVFSTGDLHVHKVGRERESPLSSESNAIIESMNRASKYSPEEKKERIERYRTKRTQRNFNKKIKYACRKTLADSRPRVRGRFARNDEIEKYPEAQYQWSNASGEEDEEDNDNWLDLLNAFSANSLP